VDGSISKIGLLDQELIAAVLFVGVKKA